MAGAMRLRRTTPSFGASTFLRGGWPVRHLEPHRDVEVSALRTAHSIFQKIEWHCLTTRPDECFHVQLGRGVAYDNFAAMALRMLGSQKATDADAPAELPGFAEGFVPRSASLARGEQTVYKPESTILRG
jgi:hypothetical protein